jgi:hypothetical protein
MAHRSLTILLACTLLLLPALCAGGWVLHPCDCESTLGCEHETDCASDPCETGIARPDSGMDDHFQTTTLPCVPALASHREADMAEIRLGGPIAEPVVIQNGLPFPPATLPLLI